MAKFNQVATNKTVNREGHVAYSMADKAKLVTQVLTSFFNESKFYGDNSKRLRHDTNSGHAPCRRPYHIATGSRCFGR